MNNYTQLPLETKIDGGVVEVCPHCHRAGLATVASGVKSYLHKIWSEFGADNSVLTNWDSCPKELPKDSEPKPKDIID